MKRLVLLFVLAAIAAYAFRAALLPPVARFLDVSADCRLPVQYTVPLPGDDDTRTLAAASLHRHGYAEKVVVLQAVASPQVADGILPPSGEVTRGVLMACGIDADEIRTLQGESSSTFTDSLLLGQLWEEAPEARVAIVSNGYHLRRARWSVERNFPERAQLVSYVAAPIDGWDASDWWQSEAGLSSVLSEYAKIGFYVARYGTIGQQAVLVLPVVGVGVIAGFVVFRRRRVARG